MFQNKKKRLPVVILLLTAIDLLPLFVSGQHIRKHQEEEIANFRLQHHAVRKYKLDMKLDTAIQLSKQKKYLAANKLFILLLQEYNTIPSKMVYYFGENSFHLEKYEQSIDWLNKYLKLEGTTALFFSKAIKCLKNAEKKILIVKHKHPVEPSSSLPFSQNNYNTYNSSLKIVCPVCKGSTVIIQRKYTKNIYKTCPYCNYQGYLNTEEYNKITQGKVNNINDK